METRPLNSLSFLDKDHPSLPDEETTQTVHKPVFLLFHFLLILRHPVEINEVV